MQSIYAGADANTAEKDVGVIVNAKKLLFYRGIEAGAADKSII